MTEIIINEIKTEEQYNDKSTLNEVINNIFLEEDRKSSVLIDVYADGKKLDLTSSTEFDHEIDFFSKIEIITRTDLELAHEALDSCSYYIDVVIEKIQETVELYSSNQMAGANTRFSEVIEIMDLFIQLVLKINKTLRKHSTGHKNKNLQNLEIHLLSILKALVPAREKNDIIMLCDLLEYELVDNLKQWKITAIPELKSIKTN